MILCPGLNIVRLNRKFIDFILFFKILGQDYMYIQSCLYFEFKYRLEYSDIVKQVV